MERLFRHEIKTADMMMKHQRGASVRAGKEFHVYHEIILFLGGDAELITEHLRLRLAPETLIVIPKETYHQVVIHGDPERYHRCVVNFDESEALFPLIQCSMTELKVLEADKAILYLFRKLAALAEGSDEPVKFLPEAVLAVLLSEIADKDRPGLGERPQNGLVRNAVRYIEENLGKKLTVAAVAQACNTSGSSLAHTFKREMNLPLHRYILKKRLIMAHNRIAAGEPATLAAYHCGFNDYSGFYKQYKKEFGVSPAHKFN